MAESRRCRCFCTSLTAAGLVAAAAASSAHATFPGRNGRIALTAVVYSHESNDYGSGIVSINPDGSDPRLLAGGKSESATYRPDGHMIAFQRPRGVFLMRADGSGERSLIPGRYADPDWSPDGKRLVLSRTRKPGGVVIWRRGRLRRLTSGYGPAWSPTGRHIVFSREDRAGGTSSIHLIRPDGARSRRLADGYAPEWSPDGRRIIFTRLWGRTYSIRPDGTDLRLVTPVLTTSPVYSPDGRLIAYNKRLPGGYSPDEFVLMMRADGRRRTRIFNVSGWGGLPWGGADSAGSLDWQPLRRR